MWVCFIVLCTSSLALASEYPVPSPTIGHPFTTSAEYRLPTHAIPSHYALSLTPDFDTFTFEGLVGIELDIIEEATNITLHAHELTISEAEIVVLQIPGYFLEISNVTYDEEKHFVILNFDFNITLGSYVLAIPYTGLLNDNNVGFYRASYVDANGVTRWLATTQFEATHARQAFPCFDEPGLKAQFSVNIIRPTENYASISNMPLLRTEYVNDTHEQDVFERSITMSTYLVAFVVSDFAYVEQANQRVYAASHLIEDGRGDYALESGIALLDILEEFTNISYQIEKLDQVALPSRYFNFGAMENWGLVIYREPYLLYKENVTTAEEEQFINVIIAHEYAHQWFGNLVTPAWWTYIWLNEGFATYFEWYAVSVRHPTWRLMEQVAIRSVQYAFEGDALETTRPMSTDAGDPYEIDGLFDLVAYDKSGSIVRMLEHIVTTPVFRSGLELYLEEKSYDAAEPADLWNSLQTILDDYDEAEVLLPAGETVESIMETWASQSGYPVLSVQRHYIFGTINVTQERFLLHNATHELDELWKVPINIATLYESDFSNTTTRFWLTERNQLFDSLLLSDSWLIINKRQTGYYRVNYDEVNWRMIIEYLRFSDYESIDPINRAQILDDAFNLARSGRLTYRILLDLLEYVSWEIDYVPLFSFRRGLTFLDGVLSGTRFYNDFRQFVVDVLQRAYYTVGTQVVAGEPVTDIYNRISITNLICLYGDRLCRDTWHGRLSEEPAQVHPNLQSIVYCSGMRLGTEDDWQYLYNKYHAPETEELERARILTGLGCSLDENYLERLLNISLGWDSQYDLNYSTPAAIFSAVYSGSDVGHTVTFDYLLSYFPNISNSLSVSQVSSLLNGLSLRAATEGHLGRLETHLDLLADDLRHHEPALVSAIRNVNLNLAWHGRSIEEIGDWFDNRVDPIITVTAPPTTPSTIAPNATDTTNSTATPTPSPPTNATNTPTPTGTVTPPTETTDDDAVIAKLSSLLFALSLVFSVLMI